MPDFVHRPVMMVEVLAAMRPQAGGCYADGTVGGAGHAAAILAASSPTGRLFGCDRDGAAVEAAQARLAEFAGRFEIRRGNHAELAEWVPAGSCDAVLLDLGVSSAQLDRPERGFSFQQDGPLDMRMDTRQPYWRRARRLDGYLDAIAMAPRLRLRRRDSRSSRDDLKSAAATMQIGRASCRERV